MAWGLCSIRKRGEAFDDLVSEVSRVELAVILNYLDESNPVGYSQMFHEMDKVLFWHE